MRWVCLVSLAWLLAGCSSGPGRGPAQAEAYVGPATLRLRQEVGPRAPEVAVLRHGDRVEIISRRRRFVKIRTAQGAEGWTDLQQLLTSAEMQELKGLAQLSARMPSQGAATVFDGLNVHTAPHRQAPSFHRIREGELVDMIDHQVAARVPYQPRLATPEPKPAPKPKPAKDDDALRLSPPPPPKPPDNWLGISGWSRSPQPPRTAPKPVPLDDWSLVRLADGRAGWSLTRILRMNIPDEVAQYSEGRRITSYFSLGQVRDGDQIKHNWLWTTISRGLQPHQFDSFRYFVWSLRHHRYETAYIERNLKGYYPVTVHPVEVTAGRRPRTINGFSIIVEDADGVRYRRTYTYENYVVRLVGKTPLSPTTPP